jgi:hypothetical protein
VLHLDDERIVQIARDQVIGSIADSKLPTPRAVRERDCAGRADVPERGDQLLLSFSEPIDPASVLSSWDGRSVGIALKVVGGRDRRSDTVTVFDRTRHRPAALGKIELKFDKAKHRDHSRFAAARMTLEKNDIVVTLRDALAPATPAKDLLWTPSPKARDLGGNGVLDKTVQDEVAAPAGHASCSAPR